MSDQKYEPGGVYVATVRGVPNVRVVRAWSDAVTDSGRWITPQYQLSATGNGWFPAGSEVTDVRRLVVLDIPKRVIPSLIEYLRGTGNQKIKADRLDDIADQIESQARPPKPLEPKGLGAVVEDADGERWAKAALGGCGWVKCNSRTRRDSFCYVGWEFFDAVRVLSEGVPA